MCVSSLSYALAPAPVVRAAAAAPSGPATSPWAFKRLSLALCMPALFFAVTCGPEPLALLPQPCTVPQHFLPPPFPSASPRTSHNHPLMFPPTLCHLAQSQPRTGFPSVGKSSLLPTLCHLAQSQPRTGFPSVGKSSLLTLLTGTESEAAAYEFTTLTCIPGVIHYNDSKIQLLDLPGIIEGASQGKGRGRQVSNSCKCCCQGRQVLKQEQG